MCDCTASADVAGIDEQDSLYTLGLESLHLVMLRNQIKSDLAVDVPLAEIVSDPNLGYLANVVKDHLERTDGTMQEQAASTVQPPRKTFEPDTLEKMTAAEARQTLTELDSLTDEEVNILLEKALDRKIEA